MSNVHPKIRPDHPTYPFPSENDMAEDSTVVLEQQRKSSGNLTDDPKDMLVKDSKPFKNLSSR